MPRTKCGDRLLKIMQHVIANCIRSSEALCNFSVREVEFRTSLARKLCANFGRHAQTRAPGLSSAEVFPSRRTFTFYSTLQPNGLIVCAWVLVRAISFCVLFCQGIRCAGGSDRALQQQCEYRLLEAFRIDANLQEEGAYSVCATCRRMGRMRTGMGLVTRNTVGTGGMPIHNHLGDVGFKADDFRSDRSAIVKYTVHNSLNKLVEAIHQVHNP